MDQPVAIVTGGGRGIGKAIALRLSQQGMAVVVCGIEPDELQTTLAEIEGHGRSALKIFADVRHQRQVKDLAAQVQQSYGRIDVLVNNAAIIGPTAPVAEVEASEWQEVLDVNLTGPFLCCQAVLPVMMQQRSGRIINIASIAGKIAYPLRSPYAVSKWGLIGLTLTLAKEAAPYNILINAIGPGPVAGPRMQRIIEMRAAEQKRSREEVEQEYLQTTLLGRMVEPEHVAEMVAMLCSPAGQSMTGQILDITAGYAL